MEETIDLKAIRERLGESQSKFGERFGVDQATIHRWEKYGLPKRGYARKAVEGVIADLRENAEMRP